MEEQNLNVPGPQSLAAGDSVLGYYGFVEAADLIHGVTLARLVGLDEGTAHNADTGWFKYVRNGRVCFGARQTLRYGVSYDTLAALGLVDGTATITLGGVEYRVRLFEGTATDPCADGTDYDAQAGVGSEWNQVFYRLTDDANYRNVLDPEHPFTQWGSYSDAELGVASGYGCCSWAQEVHGGSSSGDRVGRGYFGGSGLSRYFYSYTNSSFGWRPVLEPVADPLTSGEEPTTHVTGAPVKDWVSAITNKQSEGKGLVLESRLNAAQRESLVTFRGAMLDALRDSHSHMQGIYCVLHAFSFYGLLTGKEFRSRERASFYFTGEDRGAQVEVFEEGMRGKIESLGYICYQFKANCSLILDAEGVSGYINSTGGASYRTASIAYSLPSPLHETLTQWFEEKRADSIARPLTLYRVGRKGEIHTQTETVNTAHARGSSHSHYPSFQSSPAEVWKAFSESDANVLVMVGPPGTGKTTFIREMLNVQGWNNVSVIDDEKVINHPSLSMELGDVGQDGVVVFEDADNFVRAREEGNDNMSALLNTTEGLVKTDTKFIISTNLKNLKSIDEALVRPGRAHRVLEFKLLNFAEAKAVREEMGLSVGAMDTSKQEWTLAEAINLTSSEDEQERKAVFGFA